jgi:uncharacterized protein YbjT (DUF2867 family)
MSNTRQSSDQERKVPKKTPEYTVAVLGASGYVGNRVVTRLLGSHYKVRAAARSLAKMKHFSWHSHPDIELVEFDALELKSVKQALAGCTHAIYLIHSMNSKRRDFVKMDRQAAQNVVAAGNETSLRQLIYLGGLAEDWDECSEHLRSRIEVGNILQNASFPATVLRAAMIIGSGSASFEMLRFVTDRCPVMVAPNSIDITSQPIAITNLLNYLIDCLDNPLALGKTFDVGGPDTVTYRQMVNIYASEAGLPERRIFCVPIDNPDLGAFCLSRITPLPEPFIRSIISGIKTSMTPVDDKIKAISAQELVSVKQAIRRASDKQQMDPLDWSWSNDNLRRPDEWANENDPAWAGGRAFVDCKRLIITGRPQDVWKALSDIGGETGWYGTDWLWQLRQLVDLLFNGTPLYAGRTNADRLVVGERVDWWRIHCVRENELLVLKAEMNLPGHASLEYRLKRLRGNRTEIRQTVRFLPKGLSGELYWHAVKPIHDLVFSTMLKGLAHASSCPIAKWTPWTILEDMFGDLDGESKQEGTTGVIA